MNLQGVARLLQRAREDGSPQIGTITLMWLPVASMTTALASS
jgi:hypothetical protein